MPTLVRAKGAKECRKSDRSLQEVYGKAYLDVMSALLQGYESVENKTHWRRDALLAEDRIRSRNKRVVRSLVLLRNAALFLLLHAAPFDPVPETIERLARHPSKALALILSKRPRLKPKE